MVKMVLGSADQQAADIARAMNERIEAYSSAKLALENFNAASELTSAAYDSGKAYGVGVIVPLIQGYILLSENLSLGASNLPKKYRSEVGEEDLDSDVLEAAIVRCESSLISMRGLQRLLERSDQPSANALNRVSAEIFRLSDLKTQYQTKLNKLRAFDLSSTSAFSDMSSVSAAMAEGLGQIRTSFANFDGSFHLPSAEESGWINTLNGAWAERNARIEQAKVEAAKAVKKALKEGADDAHKAGEINDKEYKDILKRIEFVVNQFLETPVGQLTQESLSSLMQDYVSETTATYFINYILPKSPELARNLKGYISRSLIKYGLIASIQTSGTPVNSYLSSMLDSADDVVGAAANNIDDVGAAGNALSNSNRFKTHLPTVIGSGLDFSLQLYQGEEVGDAVVKTTAHTAITAVGAAVGKAAGAGTAWVMSFTPLAPVAVPIGTAVDTGLTFGISVGGSWAFDEVYLPFKKNVEDGWENVRTAFDTAVFD